MAGLDKDEFLAAVGSLERVFLRFGSTRWLNYFTFDIVVVILAMIDQTKIENLAWMALGLGVATLISFIIRPHGGKNGEA